MRLRSWVAFGLILLNVTAGLVWPEHLGPKQTGLALGLGGVYAEEAWRAEFDEICSKTDEAETLSADELKALIARSDRLKPVLEKLEESARKVYVRRLQMCRELYQYTLQVKESR